MMDYIFREFKRRPGRILCTISGFAAGVCIFTVCSLLLYNNNSRLWNILSVTGTHFIAFKPVCCEVPYVDDPLNEGFFVNGLPSNPFPGEIVETIAKSKYVKDAAPFILFRIKIEYKNPYITIGGLLRGESVSIMKNSCAAADIIEGRFFTDKDQDVVLIDEGYAKISEYRMNDILTLPDAQYTIIGMVNTGVKPVKADIYMPYETAEKCIQFYTNFPVKGLANVVLVESRNSLLHQSAIKEVQSLVGNDWITSTYGCYKPAADAISTNNIIISVLLFTLVLFLMIFTCITSYTSLVERRKDFGILFALGWSKGRLIGFTILEGCVQTITGCLAGLFLSFLIMMFIPGSIVPIKSIYTDDIPFVAVVVQAFGYTFLAGILAGVLPGFMILRKTPGEIIRGS